MSLVARIERAGGAVDRVPFAKSPVRIGRNPLNDLPLEHPMVSQWHGSLRFDRESVWLMDLGSTNGTLFNGSPLSPRHEVMLSPRDVVTMGPLRVSFSLVDMAPKQVRQMQRLASGEPLPSENTTMFFRPQVLVAEREERHTMMMNPSEMPVDIRALRQAIEKTTPAYKAFLEAWGEVERQLEARLATQAPKDRKFTAETLAMELPAITAMPGWFELLERLEIPNDGTSVDARRWLARLQPTPLPSQTTPFVAMERVGGLLETFTASFAAMRRGLHQFGDDMGLRLFGEDEFDGKEDAQQVMSVLLNWSIDSEDSIEILKRGFADLAIHQVAVIQGVVEGVREMLSGLDPAASPSTALATPKKPSFLDSLPLIGPARSWKRFRQSHRALLEEDRFTREIFGRAFARAYFRFRGQDDAPTAAPGVHQTQQFKP